MKYECPCGYIYDPAENNGIPFEELPENWECPTCSLSKEVFSPVE